MKSFKALREDMEIFTHKKKLAATSARVKAVQQKHTDAAKKHMDLANAAHAKTDANLPNNERLADNTVRSHLVRARYHKAAAKANTHLGGSDGIPSLKTHDWQKKHLSSSDIKHSEKLHKELVGAHAAHTAALKKSPQQKLKALGKKIKSKLTSEQKDLDEISNKTLDSYIKKADRQYTMSIKRQDDDRSYTDKKRAFHKARVKRRHKGIGSFYKRDDARRNPDGSHAAKYIHKPSAGDRITTGTAKGSAFGGDTLRNKPSSKLPKTYRNPNREGFDSAAQRKAEMDRAMAAFKKRGGKIKKLPPAKAQGYHGKDDPGKDVRGMLDKPDTKKSVMGTRKKAKSMGEVTMPPKKEIMKHIGDTKNAGQAREILKKKYGVSDKHADKMINHSMGQSEAMISTSSGPFGINPKVGLRVMKKGKEVPPTPPKIGVVSYTGRRKDKLPPHLSGKKDEAMIIRSKKPASKLRRDAESRPTGVREISKAKLGRYMKKVPASAAQAGDMMARPTPGAPGSAAKMDKGVKKFVKRTKGAAMAADKLTGKAKVPAK